MPGSVQNANPLTVMPWSLCRSFQHSREFAVLVNEYKNGECQRGRLVETSRKRWSTTRSLTAAVLEEFRDFWNARRGPTEPFFVYDPWDTDPKFSYDPTGSETVGRYCVRFDCPWEQTSGLGRLEAPVIIIELA